MKKAELIVIWQTGEKQIYPCDSYEAAKQAEANMRKAFGSQISWTGINEFPYLSSK